MMRLQKYLALAEVASRRKAEELILAGLVKVNGLVVTELGIKVVDNDRVEYRGQLLKAKQDKIYLALNKPVDYISSTTSSQGQSVLDLINITDRIYPVGRLDKDSSGLILLTNDGDFANRITHAKYGCEKEYEVTIDQSFLDFDKNLFESGMRLAGYKLQPVKVTLIKDKVVRLILKEGINRQIRKMMAKCGYEVIELKRIRIGKLKLDNLKLGEWKKISATEV